jgi:hypothetical protein
LGTGTGYHPLRMLSEVVEDMLHELTIKDIEEKPPVPPASREIHRCERHSLTTKQLGVTEALAFRKGIRPHAAEDSLDARAPF